MDIRYINLARRTDRRAAMEAQFGRLGLVAERIEAVEPAGLSPTLKARALDTRRYRHLTPPELCCNLSHLEAARRLLASPSNHALILEDDAVLSPRLPGLLAAIDNGASPCPDILRLETYGGDTQLSVLPLDRFAGFDLHSVHGWSWGAAAYVLSRRAATALLASPLSTHVIIDRVLNRLLPDHTGLVCRQLVPALAIQLDRLTPGPRQGSDIEAERLRAGQQASSRAEPVLHAVRRIVDNELAVGLPASISRLLGRSHKRQVAFLSD